MDHFKVMSNVKDVESGLRGLLHLAWTPLCIFSKSGMNHCSFALTQDLLFFCSKFEHFCSFLYVF